MTSRQARKLRREEERKAKKAAYRAGLKAHAAAPSHTQAEMDDEFSPEFLAEARAMRERIARRVALRKETAPCGPRTPESPGFVSQNDPPPAESTAQPGFVSQTAPPTRTRAEINRANAAHSTGPRSSTGKLASSRNSLKHGLASGQLIIPGEDPAEFESLLESLLADHLPAHSTEPAHEPFAGPCPQSTEELLVYQMAQSWWLAQRAVRLQNECFTPEGINEKRLALFLRYQTTHERAFHRALNTLIRLQKDRRQAPRKQRPSVHQGVGPEEHGFVSQQRSSIQENAATKPGPEEPGFVSQHRPANAA